jgi:hypothetical protein
MIYRVIRLIQSRFPIERLVWLERLVKVLPFASPLSFLLPHLKSLSDGSAHSSSAMSSYRQRRIPKVIEVCSPPNRDVQVFSNDLRRYFPVRWTRKTGGGVDIFLHVYAGRERRRFQIATGMPLDQTTAESLRGKFWDSYRALARQKLWFGWH